MKNFLNKIFIFFLLLLFPTFAFAELDLFVTPIKYELKLNPGDVVSKIATLRNRGEESVYITTGKINATTSQNSSEPTLVEIGNPNQELASWITIDNYSSTLSPLGEFPVIFTIRVPENATPGGHYGAVYFQYNSKDNVGNIGSGESTVNVVVNYAVLILVEVSGDIIEEGGPGQINIGKKPGGGFDGDLPEDLGWTHKEIEENPTVNKNNPINVVDDTDEIDNSDNNKESDNSNKGGLVTDNCPFGDFSKTNFDGKCFDEIKLEDIISIIDNDKKDSPTDNEGQPTTPDKPILEEEKDFSIDFTVPFENNGNTHLKPTGQITFIDEDGNQIKGIGTENIVDNNGIIIGEKITDYLPINQEDSNVLPDTQRDFTYIWKGFPYERRDENGKIVIDYMTPSQYYSEKERTAVNYIYPWNKVYYVLKQKKLQAITVLEYTKSDGEIVEFNSAEEFNVNYISEVLGYNIYFFISTILFVLFIFLIIFLIKRIGKKKCEKCKKRIKKDMKVCPYCGTRQKTKKITNKE